MAKYTITHVQHYPIYEPAEGGYYYGGLDPIAWVTVSNVKDALKHFHRMVRSLGYTRVSRATAHDEEHLTSRYIGEGRSIVLERGDKPLRIGYTPYC